jgi:hypothetical protein
MTPAEAEQTVRDLVDRYGSAPWQMPDIDADLLAEAIAVLGQDCVLEIAEAHARRTS